MKPAHPELLSCLGARLRARRLDRGLTQAALADAAGVSPRFLIDVERGHANISVQRLAAICGALHYPLPTLFAGLEGGRKVALVGLRGAGKTAVGGELAARLECPFVELDGRVEAAAGMTLGELFELRGEAWYRELESRVLDEELARPGPLVIATGGSLVTSARAWARLRGSAHTVWLRASPTSHLERVRSQGDLRPMEGRPDALGELEAILAERAPLYDLAEWHVDTDALGLAGVIDLLADRLGALG